MKKLSPDIQAKIIEKLEGLAEEPRPAGVRKLQGEDNLYRVRSGDYRIIYEIQDDILLILVAKIGHRRDVYK
ncbi:MAG: type II toxin-antitoxin system RelE/ParE family toxin [Rivularia sp. (in: cyanobacteria)]